MEDDEGILRYVILKVMVVLKVVVKHVIMNHIRGNVDSLQLYEQRWNCVSDQGEAKKNKFFIKYRVWNQPPRELLQLIYSP